jgi:acyl dehydratase
MTLQVRQVLDWQFPVVEREVDERSAILYALGIGLGADPTDPRQLRFLYEEGLEVFPTMGLVLGHPGPWYSDPRTGIDWVAVLHGEQELVVHAPLQPRDKITCATRVTGVVDKGPGRGALVYWERVITRTGTGEPLFTLSSTLVCRNDGGCGGPAAQVRPPIPRGTGEPDAVIDLPVSARAGLIYRLSGDLNPLHVDPAVARQAGFDRPILHGLCTLAIAVDAIVRACLDYRNDRIGEVRARFSAPFLPGETLRTQIWGDGDGLTFRCLSVERDTVVIDAGHLREAAA